MCRPWGTLFACASVSLCLTEEPQSVLSARCTFFSPAALVQTFLLKHLCVRMQHERPAMVHTQ